MAQNITLLNANYSDVPAVELPKTGGGVASFTDVTDTTATAEDVAQGKYFYNAAGVKTAGTSSGGGSIGGLAQMIETSDANYQYQFMLSQIKKGQTVGGTITFTAAFPNTESLLISTGLQTLHGIMFTAINNGVGPNSGGVQSAKWLFILIYDNAKYIAANVSANNGTSFVKERTLGTNYAQSPEQGTLRVDGGDIYYTARYNKNANYQILMVNQLFEWLAW